MQIIYFALRVAWQVVVKNAKVKLVLLTDIDILLMFEKRIKVGMYQSVNRYIK